MKIFCTIAKSVICVAMALGFAEARGMGYCYENSCISEGVDAAIDFTAGYRYDKYATSVHVFDPPETLVLTDNLKFNNLNVYEIGVDSRILVCREWLVRLYATFGKIHDGTYTEVVTAPGIGQATVRSNARKGNTSDFSVGGGYLFPCSCGFGVGPIAGWSYDYQKVKIGTAKTDGVCDPVLSDLSYKMRWQGPWLGIQGQFMCYDAEVSLGYEYHWSHWHASWSLAGPDVPEVAFSDRRKCNSAFGNVIFLNGAYFFCDCWEVRLGLKAQYWKAPNGDVSPRDVTAIISLTEQDKVHSATWHAYEALLMVGYHF